MSASICIVAQRKLTDDDFKAVKIYNDCWDIGVDPPPELTERLTKLLGEKALDDETISVSGDFVDIDVGDGYDIWHTESGVIVKLDGLPPNTIAIRIFARA